MPSRWTYATNPEDVEQSAPSELDHTSSASFDGFWEATMAVENSTSSTTVIISGRNVFHEGGFNSKLKVLNAETCVIITDYEDVRGYLSADGDTIDWEDGDCWRRVAAPKAEQCEDRQDQEGQKTESRNGAVRQLTAMDALLQRDGPALSKLLSSGATPGQEVEPTAEFWETLRWRPESDETAPMPLIVAAILLQWPEGVEICVQKGADVNALYEGPFRGSDGCIVREKNGAPLLRVAVSTRGPAQCTICQHLLAGKVRGRTFQSVRKKAKEDMDFVTRRFFDTYMGPFAETTT